MELPPIALFAYSRPQHLLSALRALERSMDYAHQKFPLYIFCDHWKSEEKRESVQECIRIAQNWPGAEVVVREKNFGFNNIVEGISSLCSRYGRAIVIEDDVIVSPDFLPYMRDALQRYEKEKRVFMSSGFMYAGRISLYPKTFFLPTAFIWGWATWERAWTHFSWNPQGWEEFLQDKKARYHYNIYGSFPFSKNLEKTMTGKWSSWASPWMFIMHRERALGLYPSRSLVWNAGVGGGVHGSALLDKDPALSQREGYIHGNKSMSDFERPQLFGKKITDFPEELKESPKALRSLALTFLRQRMVSEPKKRHQLLLKFLWRKFSVF